MLSVAGEKKSLKISGWTPQTYLEAKNRYQTKYELMPQFRDWIIPDPSSMTHAMCKYCLKRLVSSIDTLRKHSQCAKHIKNTFEASKRKEQESITQLLMNSSAVGEGKDARQSSVIQSLSQTINKLAEENTRLEEWCEKQKIQIMALQDQAREAVRYAPLPTTPAEYREEVKNIREQNLTETKRMQDQMAKLRGEIVCYKMLRSENLQLRQKVHELNTTISNNWQQRRATEAANEQKQSELRLKYEEAQEEVDALKIKLKVELVVQQRLKDRVLELQRKQGNPQDSNMIIENVDESVDETKETDKNIDDSEISAEKPINESVKVFLGDQKIKAEIFDVNSLNEKQETDLN